MKLVLVGALALIFFAAGFALLKLTPPAKLPRVTKAVADVPAAPTMHPSVPPLNAAAVVEENANESLPDSPDRVADARRRFSQTIRAAFAAATVAYPPRAIFLRGFKHERQLELWARPAVAGANSHARAPYRLVRTIPILRASGRLGPKRREGDWQVPEGFYTVAQFNPRSNFYLSLGLDYPNVSDRLLTTDAAHPGSEIFLHGGAASVGCLALGDRAAAQLYLVALDTREQSGQRTMIPVHLFPCRLDAANWENVLTPLAAAQPALLAFWRGLQPGYDAFEREKIPPSIKVQPDGAYALDSR